ncbi:MAG: hypothetical protein AB1505_32550 [Candidatus Latescibacterota bacterium]
MWRLVVADACQQRLDQLKRKNDQVVVALFSNLDDYLRALNGGLQPMQVKLGCLHPEKHHGLVAIDTKGAATKLPETRLYVYPDVETRTLHLITLGGKNTQQKDLKVSRKYVDCLREGARNG